MAQITDLDDFTLLSILNLIPLGQLLPVRQVCKKWSCLIVDEITSKRPSLSLFASLSARDNYRRSLAPESLQYETYRSYDSLIIPSLASSEAIRLLVKLFPVPRGLFLHFMPQLIDGALTLLATYWKESLITLTLFFSHAIDDNNMGFGLRSLWTTLGSMVSQPTTTTLRHLAFTSLENEVHFPRNLRPIGLLSSLSFYNFGEEDAGLLIKLMINSLASESTRELTVEQTTMSVDCWRYIFTSKPYLRKNLTSLKVNVLDANGELGVAEEMLTFLATRCIGLTHLDVRIKPEIHMESLSTNLKRFRRLTHLTLRSANKFIFSEIDPTENNSDLMVPSIRSLRLHLHIKLDKLQLLSTLFPSVDNLAVDFSWITCRCVSRQRQRHLDTPASPMAICPRCLQQTVDHLVGSLKQLQGFTKENLGVRLD